MGLILQKASTKATQVHTNTGLREDFLGKGQRAGKGVITLEQSELLPQQCTTRH